LVHLVLDRLAAQRHLDDDVDVLGRVVPYGDGVQAHGASLRCEWGEGWGAGGTRRAGIVGSPALARTGPAAGRMSAARRPGRSPPSRFPATPGARWRGAPRGVRRRSIRG